MGFQRWFASLFGRQSEIPDGLPDVMGRVIDEHGEEHELRKGAIKHDALTSGQLQRIARLSDVLQEAYPMSPDGWVDGFMRDANPESEIQIIEAVAVVYAQLAENADLRSEGKRMLYGVLCVLSAGGPSPELEEKIPGGLPTGAELFDMYRAARAAGDRP